MAQVTLDFLSGAVQVTVVLDTEGDAIIQNYKTIASSGDIAEAERETRILMLGAAIDALQSGAVIAMRNPKELNDKITEIQAVLTATDVAVPDLSKADVKGGGGVIKGGGIAAAADVGP